MEKNVNYQIKMDEILKKVMTTTQETKRVPMLLLHACCAPCSSYVLEYLSQYFNIIIFFYNPNISEEKEYQKRVDEVKRLVSEMPHVNDIRVVEGDYEPDAYKQAIAGMEHLGERSARCYACYELRLRQAAIVAKELRCEFFTTTLSISPHKNANWLNEIGERMQEEYDVPYLYADFKKRNGYKRSIELSAVYNLYRQDFCGCSYSKAEEAARKNTKRGLSKK